MHRIILASILLLVGCGTPATAEPQPPGGPVSTAQTTLEQWSVDHLAFAQENLICCTKKISIIERDPLTVEVEISGEMAAAPSRAREAFAHGMMNNFQLTHGVCLRRVVFLVGGRLARGNLYENSQCD